MPSRGTSLVDATCPSKSIRKHMKLINKPCTVMVGTPRSGALLVCYTTKSTNTAMRLTLTRELSG